MINRIREFYRNRQVKVRDMEFRTGFLHAIDRRLFPDATPLLQEPDAQRLRIESSSFNTGAVWGDSLHITSTTWLHIENARRIVTSV
jgi:hypothetical protein